MTPRLAACRKCYEAGNKTLRAIDELHLVGHIWLCDAHFEEYRKGVRVS